MTPRAQERSAFCAGRGLYHFKRMPFGLSNAPATFCRLMHKVLWDHLWRICLCYLDDVIVYATSQRELLERVHTILSCFNNVGLKVKPSKCSLFKERISFLEQNGLSRGNRPSGRENSVYSRLASAKVCPRCARLFRTCIQLPQICSELRQHRGTTFGTDQGERSFFLVT